MTLELHPERDVVFVHKAGTFRALHYGKRINNVGQKIKRTIQHR